MYFYWILFVLCENLLVKCIAMPQVSVTITPPTFSPALQQLLQFQQQKNPNANMNNQTPAGEVFNGATQQSSLSQQRPQSMGNSNVQFGSRNPIPFTGRLSSSVGNFGSTAINAKSQTASNVLDGVSYGVSRIPSVVGYGVQEVGRLENAAENLFKAVLGLGTSSVTNGMEGVTLGMNAMSGLSTAGMKGISTVANGSIKILEHILSLGTSSETGLINTLVALGRLLSPATIRNFQNSGLNLDTLLNAASYLNIPSNNQYLNSIMQAAGALRNSSMSLDSIRQTASNAASSLGLTTAWNMLSSRLRGNENGGDLLKAINTASKTNNPLPINENVNTAIPQASINAQPISNPGDIAKNAADTTSSWLGSWMG